MTLGKAHMGLSEFSAAEASLLEAHPIFVENRHQSHRDITECTGEIIDLYAAWQEAEPDQGYDDKVTEWQNKLNALSQPTTGGNPENNQ